MPRHMPRTAREPRGVNKIHGLVVTVRNSTVTQPIFIHFISGSRETAANRSRHSILSQFHARENRATCPCSSDGRASTSAMPVVRFHPRATCTQSQAVLMPPDICKCGVIGSTSVFHSDSAGSSPVICSKTLWSAKQLNTTGSSSGCPLYATSARRDDVLKRRSS